MNSRSLLLSCALGLAACSDPAQNATAARVEQAVEPAPTPAAGTRTSLTLDRARSSVGFTGAKVTASHDGRFEQFSGTMELDPATLENSSVQITIQMASLQIEPERLRGHLQSPDLFDVEHFPTATFESTRIVRGGENATHTVTGNLALHGHTRSISFPATIESSDTDVHARAEFSIDRRDFGIVYPGMPDDLIRDGVVVRFDVHFPRG